ncbi:uncharacterized protein LOC141666305 [Apium graveolens]|uniref:uncharacterized protein LOC141666305 n=1 Tax=Apium graveolens TaxID=4045 RepID=UPI003D7BF5CF
MSVEETVGSLKAHEERVRGKNESSDQQLLLTEEEWVKRENKEGQLLLTRDEWVKRANRGSSRGRDVTKGRDFSRGGRDRNNIRCFNCSAYGHYAAECRKPRREKEQTHEANLAYVNDDEPTLLLAECHGVKDEMFLLHEGGVSPKLNKAGFEGQRDISVWYLDNGASNHMTGYRHKFTKLDEGVRGRVKFGDGSTVEIHGKGSINLTNQDGKECTLKEVYFIPSLCNNIISLGQLSEGGNKVIIKGEFLWI